MIRNDFLKSKGFQFIKIGDDLNFLSQISYWDRYKYIQYVEKGTEYITLSDLKRVNFFQLLDLVDIDLKEYKLFLKLRKRNKTIKNILDGK